jgi:hypothetical protein
MTAQVVIMNKEAIALASDSAVTMTQEKGQKIFTSANKLFSLSKYYPIGIMIYGNAYFMDMPWETIIKIYRNKLNKKSFAKLADYANNFIDYLNKDNPLFPEQQQKDYIYTTIFSYFRVIKEEIEEKLKSILEQEKEFSNAQVKKITSEVIRLHFDKLKKKKILQPFPKNYGESLIQKYSKIMEQAKEKVFEKLPITQDSANELKNITINLFTRDIFHLDISGIIIAGFGEKDAFPIIKSFDIEGIANNKLKYKERGSTEINFERAAAIIPFAQKEMVATFMEGIDPNFRYHIESYFHELFNKYPEVIVKNINKLNEQEKISILKKLKEGSKKIYKDLKNHIENYTTENHVNPIMKIVAMLPKDELAAMAESLVNLTSFKRKVTMETETVAPPY